ncbi:MAG TPA: bestrophin family ion channel [Flavisolibacter sp.]|nr:bestrophin family ion channel [Flavisolibacter sp.]
MILDTKVPFAYIFRKIRKDLLFILAVGLVFNYLTALFSAHLPEMPLGVATFLGTAISVLLSFKMSQSYDRWWEARKVWGAIVNDSRTFVMQLQGFLCEQLNDTIRVMAYRQIAWCYVLGRSLRGQNPLEKMEAYLGAEDLEALSSHDNKALALLQQNVKELRRLREQNEIDNITHLQIDSTLVRLCDAMGKAERIKSTAFPVTYRLFLHFAIYLFVIVLSIALRNIEAIFEIPLLILISGVFLLLEKTAYHLQDPYRNRPSDTPVTAIATTIEINLRQLMGEKDVPKPAPVGSSFYVL